MVKDRNHRPLRFDALEDRTLLSGDCAASVTAKGDLVIKCDNENSFVSVEGYGDYVELEGHDGTTINGQASIEMQGFTRDLRIKSGGGDDYVYLYELDVPRNLNFNGGKGADYLGGRYDSTTIGGKAKLRVEAEGLVGQGDVMQAKLNEGINQLGQAGLPEEVHRHAIDQVMESLLTSNLVPLPTPDPTPQDPDPEFDRFLDDAARAIQALEQHVNDDSGGKKKGGLGTPETKAEAAEAKNFLQVLREALQVIGGQTDFCNPENIGPSGGLGCEFLQADDEGGNVVDTVLGQIFSRQIRSPFPFLIHSSLLPNEQIIPTDGLKDGECAAVVKEIQGIKVVVTPRVIPVWVEPWFARARIVGFKTVWVAEFIPAEHIKTISVCNDNGTIVTNVETQVVLERQLLHFWRFLHKDVTAVA